MAKHKWVHGGSDATVVLDGEVPPQYSVCQSLERLPAATVYSLKGFMSATLSVYSTEAVNLCFTALHQTPETAAKASEASVPSPAEPTNAVTGGSKTRTGSRSSPRTGSRLQNPSKTGGAAAERSKEQAEKRNQALSQLRRLLDRGNRRVEALATVIQHLFTEVPTTSRYTTSFIGASAFQFRRFLH